MAKKPKKQIEFVGLGTGDKGTMDLSFRDHVPFVPGCSLQTRVTAVQYRGRSKFQDICVFQTEGVGPKLVIDGVTMLTEFDEFSYHEMITPMCRPIPAASSFSSSGPWAGTP